MCTLCLSDMGDLHDEWLREPARRPPPDDDAMRALLAELACPSPVSAPKQAWEAA